MKLNIKAITEKFKKIQDEAIALHKNTNKLPGEIPEKLKAGRD